VRVGSRIDSLQQWADAFELHPDHVGSCFAQTIENLASKFAGLFTGAKPGLQLMHFLSDGSDLTFEFSSAGSRGCVGERKRESLTSLLLGSQGR
jgi:hypothetical protein